jgi:hypothetical protein
MAASPPGAEQPRWEKGCAHKPDLEGTTAAGTRGSLGPSSTRAAGGLEASTASPGPAWCTRERRTTVRLALIIRHVACEDLGNLAGVLQQRGLVVRDEHVVSNSGSLAMPTRSTTHPG